MFALDGKPEATKYHCQECGREHMRSTGYVVRDGKAFAAYHAYLHGNDGDAERTLATFTVIFADWGKSDKGLVNAVAFRAAVREGKTDYEFMLQDPDDPKEDAGDITHLTRDQALKHPRLQDMWDCIDFIIVADPNVHALLYGHEPKFDN